MARFLMIRGGVVENACEWDGNTQTWQPPAGVEMLRSDPAEKDAIGEIGDLWDGTSFTPGAPKPQPDDPAVTKLAETMRVLVDKGIVTADELPADVKAAIEKQSP